MYQQSNIGPTEGEFSLMVIYTITGIYGQEFWYAYKIRDYVVPSALHSLVEALPLGKYILDQGFYFPYTMLVGAGCLTVIYQGFRVIFKNAPNRKGEIFNICCPMVKKSNVLNIIIFEYNNMKTPISSKFDLFR